MRLLPLLMMLLLLAACGKKDPYAAVTKEEALAFAKKLETTVRRGNTGFGNDAVNFDILNERINKALVGIKKNIDIRDFGAGKSFRFGEIIAGQILGRGHYRLVNHYRTNNEQHLVFRLYGGQQGGVNYHDITLVKPKEDVQIADVLVYITGMQISATFAEEMRTVLHEKTDEHYRRYVSQVQEDMTSKRMAGEWSDLITFYDQLPEQLQWHKAMLVMAMEASRQLPDPEAEERYMQRYRRQVKTVTDKPLVEYSYYYTREKTDSALYFLNQLDSLLHGDPHLDASRAELLIMEGRYAEADEALTTLNRSKYCFGDALYLQVFIKAMSADFDAAYTLLKKWRKMPDYDGAKANELASFFPQLGLHQ